jgi:hypothetical protein
VNKQINTCKIDVKAYNGVSNYSFQGYPKEVSVYSGAYRFTPYYYGGTKSDEALSGRIRSRLGGYRFSASLNWERLTNTQNLADVVNKATIGREKLFWNTVPANTYTAKLNIALASPPTPSGYFQGMKVDFDGIDTRTITNYNQSNSEITLNSAVSVSPTTKVNIYALSNMTPTIFFFPDTASTTNEEVILDDTTWELTLQSTVTSQPLSVSFMGSNVSNTIPSYYSL